MTKPPSVQPPTLLAPAFDPVDRIAENSVEPNHTTKLNLEVVIDKWWTWRTSQDAIGFRA